MTVLASGQRAPASVQIDIGQTTEDHIASLDWPRIADDLDARGHRQIDGLLLPEQCRDLAALYTQDALFRSRVVMARHGLWPRRVPVLHVSAARAGRRVAHGAVSPSGAHCEPLERGHGPGRALPAATCGFHSRAATTPASGGQRRCCCSTARDDYNCLHQDLYGEHVFPLQGRSPALSAGTRLQRRRIRPHRAAGRACSRVPKWCRCNRAMP